MFSAAEYIAGWLVYLMTIAGALVVFWRLTRCVSRLHLKQCLRLSVATILLLPATIDETTHYWAPAWIKGVLQLVFGEMEHFLPVATTLLITVFGVIAVYLLSVSVSVVARQVLRQE